MGDWNLNLINHHCHKATSDFLDLLYSRMYFLLITRPTRITANKASLIDNIFTNDPLRPSISGLFLNDISDHLPIFSLILYNNTVKPVLSGHRIKRTPSIKRTVAEVPKFISLVYFK